MKTKLRRRIQELAPLGNTRRFKMKSCSPERAQMEYLITYGVRTGSLTCNCAGGTHGRVCRHQDRVLAHIRRNARKSHQSHVVQPVTRAAAYQPQPPEDARCLWCNSSTADSYVPHTGGDGEPLSGAWICDGCNDARSPFDEPDTFQQEADAHEEAAYYAELNRASDFANFAAAQAEAEAAEHPEEEGAPDV